MTPIRKAAALVAAGLIFAPAPAFAATANHHPGGHHHGTHTAGLAGRKAHLKAKLAAAQHRVNGLDRTLSTAAVTGHQQQVLINRFASRDDVSGLRHDLAAAHSSKQLAAVSARIQRLSVLVPEQVHLVSWVGQVDAGLHHWRAVQHRLNSDDQCLQGNEENPQLMADLDTAVTDLTDAQDALSNDEQALLAAAGQGEAAIQAAMKQVVADLGTVTTDVLDAVTALADLESQLGK